MGGANAPINKVPVVFPIIPIFHYSIIPSFHFPLPGVNFKVGLGFQIFEVLLVCGAEVGTNLADRIGGDRFSSEGSIYFRNKRRDSSQVGRKSE